jgi:hypothetical protein
MVTKKQKNEARNTLIVIVGMVSFGMIMYSLGLASEDVFSHKTIEVCPKGYDCHPIEPQPCYAYENKTIILRNFDKFNLTNNEILCLITGLNAGQFGGVFEEYNATTQSWHISEINGLMVNNQSIERCPE